MTLLRALLTWLCLFAAAFINGTLRELTYAQQVGSHRANQVSAFTAILLLGAVMFAATRFWRFQSRAQAVRIGLLWLVMTVAWEFAFGLLLLKMPLERVLAEYALWEGRLWALVLASLVITPVLIHQFDRRR